MRAAVVTSILSKVSSVAYLILAVPLIIASVGSNGYSQFAVVLAAFGWLGPLFIGMGYAVTERIASDAARPLSDRTRGTFMTALSLSGGLLSIFTLVGALAVWSGRVGGPDHAAFAIAGLGTGLAVAGGVFDYALLGLQRSYVTNLLAFGISLAQVAATVVAAIIAPTVWAMVLATLVPMVLARILSAFVLYRAEPSLWGRIRDIEWGLAPRIAGRGLVFAGCSFAAFLSLDAGLLVVAARLGTTEVAAAALVFRVLPLVLSIVGMILVPLWPAIAEAVGDGDTHWVRRNAGRSAALVMGYAVAAGLIVLIGGGRLVSLWTGGQISIPFEMLVGAACLIIGTSSEAFCQAMLFGLGRAGSVAVVLLIRGVLSIVLVFLLTAPLGQAAALIGSIFAEVLTSAWLLPLLVVRGVNAVGRSHPAVRVGGPGEVS